MNEHELIRLGMMVQELNTLKDKYALKAGKEIESLQQQNKAYENTLKFYADDETYKSYLNSVGKPTTFISTDKGKRAKESLSHIK